MQWVMFPDKAAFVAYHDQTCVDRGIPKPGQIQATSEDALGNQWTTAWVRPVLDGLILKALVPDEDVTIYNLTPTTAPPIADIGQPSTTTKVAWDAEVDKPLPDTWNGQPVPKSTSTTTTKVTVTGPK